MEERVVKVAKQKGTLNAMQHKAFDLVLNAAQTEAIGALRLIVMGEAGTGKTYWVQTVEAALELYYDQIGIGLASAETEGKKRILKMAFTGAAAHNFGGSTIHSTLGVSVYGRTRTDTNSLLLHEKQLKFAEVKFIFVDEYSMISSTLLVQIYKALRDIFPTCSHLPFGGRHMIMLGDFLQLPPVGAQPLYAPCKYKLVCEKLAVPPTYDLEINKHNQGRRLWVEEFQHVVEFVENVRQQNDPQWHSILTHLRSGTTTAADITALQSRATSGGNDNTKLATRGVLQLHSRLADVQATNLQMIQALPHPRLLLLAEHHFVGQLDTVTEFQLRNLFKVMARTDLRDKTNLPPAMHIAIGAPVMLTANLCIPAGLFNGARGRVTGYLRDHNAPLFALPLAILVHFDHLSTLFPRFLDLPHGTVPIRTSEGYLTMRGSTVKVLRRMFPLTLAFAVSIHKSQGMSCSEVGVNLNGCFTYEQPYVALSRAKTLAGLHIVQRLENAHKLLQKRRRASSHPQLLEIERLRALINL